MPAFFDGWTMAAPAPSPNSTQVLRSLQSVTPDSTSAPTTSAHFDCPDETILSASASE